MKLHVNSHVILKYKITKIAVIATVVNVYFSFDTQNVKKTENRCFRFTSGNRINLKDCVKDQVALANKVIQSHLSRTRFRAYYVRIHR